MNRNIKLIQDMLAAEGKMEGGNMVVPADFFDRLNAALNPPQRGGGFVDRIVDAIVSGASSSINPTERE